MTQEIDHNYVEEVRRRDAVRYFDAEGRLHHPTGPAVVHPDGAFRYYWHGEFHRVGGPAIRHPNGYQAYYENDERHRLDGPAVLYADGTQEWWVRGVQLPDNPTPADIVMALL